MKCNSTFRPGKVSLMRISSYASNKKRSIPHRNLSFAFFLTKNMNLTGCKDDFEEDHEDSLIQEVEHASSRRHLHQCLESSKNQYSKKFGIGVDVQQEPIALHSCVGAFGGTPMAFCTRSSYM